MEDIKCHDKEPRYSDLPIEWKEPWSREPYSYPFRTCSYCGSIHVTDLIDLSKKHSIKLSPADPKYGGIHKFYIDGIPNPLAGKIVECGSRSENGISTPIMSEAPKHTWSKLYVQHFQDLSDEQIKELNKLLPFPYERK